MNVYRVNHCIPNVVGKGGMTVRLIGIGMFCVGMISLPTTLSAQTIETARKNPLVVYADEGRSTELCRVPADQAVGAKIEEQSANRMLKVGLCGSRGEGWVRPIDVKLAGTPSVKGDCDQRLQQRGLAAGRGLGEGC